MDTDKELERYEKPAYELTTAILSWIYDQSEPLGVMSGWTWKETLIIVGLALQQVAFAIYNDQFEGRR